MNYNVRINDNFLRGDHVDGEVLQHTDLNELESVAKTAINANYEDIQKLQDGTISIGNSEKLDGATLSKFATETLQNSDTKVPTSSQVKQYIDGAISGIDLDGYYTKRETDEILEDYPKFTDYAGPTTAGVVKINVTNIGTDISSGGYLSGANRTYDQYQNELYNTAFISKGTLENVITGKGLVDNTDYATSSKGGVIKSGYYGLQVDSTNGKAYCDTYSYANYGNVENQRFISKGTLENVITGKGLIDNTVNNLLNYYTKENAITPLGNETTINVNTLDSGLYFIKNDNTQMLIGTNTFRCDKHLFYVSGWKYNRRWVYFVTEGTYYKIERTGSEGSYTYSSSIIPDYVMFGSDLYAELESYYTKSETDTLLNAKANTTDILKPLSSSTINLNTLDAGIYYMTNSSANVTIGASTDTFNQDLIYVSEWQYENNQYRTVKFINEGTYYSIKRTGSVGAYTYEQVDYDYLAYASYLTDYVKNTDYATNNTGGVIKTGYHYFNISEGRPYAGTMTYADFQSASAGSFIGKATLNNVLTATIGDIQTLLDNLDSGSGV